MDSFSAPSLWT